MPDRQITQPITMSEILDVFTLGGKDTTRRLTNSLRSFRGKLAFDFNTNQVVRLPRTGPLSYSDFEGLGYYPEWTYNSATFQINQPANRTVFANTGSTSFSVSISNIQIPPPENLPGVQNPPQASTSNVHIQWQVSTDGGATWQNTGTATSGRSVRSSTLSINLAWNNGAVLDLDNNRYRALITVILEAPDPVTGEQRELPETEETTISNAARLRVSLADFAAPTVSASNIRVTAVNPQVVSGTTILVSPGSITVSFLSDRPRATFASAAAGRTITNETSTLTWQWRSSSSGSFATVPSAWLVNGGFDGLRITNIGDANLNGAQFRATFAASQTQSPPAETKSDSVTTNTATAAVALQDAGLSTLNNLCGVTTDIVEGTTQRAVFNVRTGNLGIAQTTAQPDVSYSVSVPSTVSVSVPNHRVISSTTGTFRPTYTVNTSESPACVGGDHGTRVQIGPFAGSPFWQDEIAQTFSVQTPGSPGWAGGSSGQTLSSSFVIRNGATQFALSGASFPGGPPPPNSGETFVFELFATNLPPPPGERTVNWSVSGMPPSSIYSGPTSGNVTLTQGLTGYVGTISFPTTEDPNRFASYSPTLTVTLNARGQTFTDSISFVINNTSSGATYAAFAGTGWDFASGTPAPGTVVAQGTQVNVQFNRTDPDYLAGQLLLNGSPVPASVKLGGSVLVAAFSMPPGPDENSITSNLVLQTQIREPDPPPPDPPPPPPVGEWCLIGGGEIFPSCPPNTIDPSQSCQIGQFGIACETDGTGITRVFEYECVEAGTCVPALVPLAAPPPVSPPPVSPPPVSPPPVSPPPVSPPVSPPTDPFDPPPPTLLD